MSELEQTTNTTPEITEVNSDLEVTKFNPNDIVDTAVVEKPASIRETLERVAKDVAPEADKADEKTDKGEKAKAEKTEAVDDDAKAAKADKAKDTKDPLDTKTKESPESDDRAEKAESDRKPKSEQGTRELNTPPSRFASLEAKEIWHQAPRAVKAEIHRIHAAIDQAEAQYREAHENWKSLEKFDTMARQNNTTVAQALDSYTRVDALLRSNPMEGIKHVLSTLNVTPEQYARTILGQQAQQQVPVQQGQYRQAQQIPQQLAQPSPEAVKVHHLEQRLQQMEIQRVEEQKQNLMQNTIVPVLESLPRGAELEGAIAKIIKSGIIDDTTLDVAGKIRVAYEMAERLNPPVRNFDDDLNVQGSYSKRDVSPAPVDNAGNKSIKGAPSSGSSTEVKRMGTKSRIDALKDAARSLGI